jgi:hypothetical protein
MLNTVIKICISLFYYCISSEVLYIFSSSCTCIYSDPYPSDESICAATTFAWVGVISNCGVCRRHRTFCGAAAAPIGSGRTPSVQSALLHQLGSFALARPSSLVSDQLGSGPAHVSWLSRLRFGNKKRGLLCSVMMVPQMFTRAGAQ